MNGFQAYRKQVQPVGTSRIDLFLSLYEAGVDRVARAETALRQGDRGTALPLLAKAQLIVSELAAGVRTDLDPVNGPNLLRLYEFVVHKLSLAEVDAAEEACRILKTLYDGFAAIRNEAVAMERKGAFLPSEQLRTVIAMA